MQMNNEEYVFVGMMQDNKLKIFIPIYKRTSNETNTN